MTLDEITAALPSLSPDELRRVLALTNALLRAEPAKQAEDAPAFAHDILSDFLRDEGVRVPPFFLFRKSREWGTTGFAEGSATLMAFIEDAFQARTSAERRAAAFLCVGTIRDALEDQKLPVRFRTLAQRLRDVGAYVDLAYPGYRRSGMLRMLLERAKCN